MHKRILDLLWIELDKLTPEEWPLGYGGPGSRGSLTLRAFSSWKPPSTWTYHDHKLPEWKREWEANVISKALAGVEGSEQPSTISNSEG